MHIRFLGISSSIALMILTAPSPAADIDRAAVTTAVRDVNSQVHFLQELFGTNDRLSQINGLFQQTMDFQSALIDFRLSLNSGAGAEQLAIDFNTVDRKLNAILGEVQFLEKDLPALKLVCNRLRFAGHNLHFAVFGGDTTPGRQADKLLRQTMAQQALVESLANNITWVFSGREALPGWKDEVAAVRQSLVDLQRVEQKKGSTADDIKAQFLKTDRTWGKLVDRYSAAKVQDKALLRSFVAMADLGFTRVANLAGVADRKTTVTDGYTK